MDLNCLYFHHQISLMRATSAEDLPSRISHQATADGIARDIAQIQLDAGAGASGSWRAGAAA